MSEEENIEYKSGDIVWVKLGSFWWPGEVTNHAPEDVTTKKPPVAIVKFFGEDNYEYVTNHKNIYPYNCSRKNEFIKKGMDSYHGKNSQVEKFPLDINTAETRTDGNVNILYDVYSQQKKTNIVAEVFGTPATKKSSKNGPHRYRHKKTSKQKSAETIRKSIKHRRFLGCDDYEMRIRVQYPGKDVEPSDEDRVPVFEDEIKKFPCSTCGFITDRLEVMLFHVQCHIKGIQSPTTSVPKEKKKSPKKSRKIIRQLSEDDDDNNGVEDDENANDGGDDTLSSIDSEEDKVKRKQKRKRKSQGNGKMKQKKIIDKEKPTIDIRTNLLAEWSDSEDIDQDTDTSKLNTSTDSTDDTKINQNNESSLNESKKNDNKDDKSCFDFEEDEDDDNSIVQTAVVGRKIPRVIPPADRRKSTEPDNENASLPLAEDDETRVGHLNKVNSSSSSNNNNNNNNNNSENLINESSSSILNDESNSTKDNSEFKELMESTSVPELPEVPDANKTQNLPIKLPEKPKIDNSTEVATRLTNPKKRFVKSFEDFELLLNEQKKAMEEVELAMEKTEDKQEKKDNKQEMVIEEKKDNKQEMVIEEKKDNKQEMVIEEKKDNKQEMEIEEKKDNKQKMGIEEKKDNKQEMEIVEKQDEKKEVSEQVAEKTVETDTKDEKINNEQGTIKEIMKIDEKESLKKTDGKQKSDPEKITHEVEAKLEISKLKCQIMSKITDEEQQKQQQKQQQQQQELAKTKTKSSHRTPRSKILESYRNDTNEKKRRKSSEDKMDDSSKQHDKHPPKKSKYLRSSNDEKQQINEEEKIEQKTDNEIIVENKVEDKQEIIETKTNETVEEDKVEEPTSSDLLEVTVGETVTNTSIVTDEKPVEEQPVKVDDNQEVSFNLNDKQDDKEVVKFDKEEEIVEDKINSDVEMKNDVDQTIEEVPIKSNLTNEEEMSALTTLATISELQTTFDNDSNKSDKVETESIPTTSSKLSFDEQFITKTTPILPKESELVPIDGNLTVVSEKDLADAQVEITADISPTNKKPVTLTTFSMDFSETPTPTIITNDNNENVVSSKIEEEPLKSDKVDEKTSIEAKIEEKIKESVIEIPPVSNTSILDEICDVEEHIPSSQIVCTQEPNLMKDEKLKVLERNPSKLLERLTTIATTHTKESMKSTKAKIQSLLTNEPKVPISKLISSPSSSTTAILASTTATTTATATTTKQQIITKPLPAKIQPKVSSPKAIILSEQIIKSETPVIGENANTVSVQKISSKRNMQDPDEIDTFIIHKSKAVSDEQNVQDNEESNKKSKKLIIESKKQQVQISTTKKRGKAKILQQTIITPSGEIVQPTIPTTQNQTPNNDENVFDINSMPIVLSDQILTPESIENMPIFLSDSSQTATEIVTTPTTKLITTNIVKKSTPSLPQQQQQQPMKILSKTVIPSTVVGTVVDKTPKIVKTTTTKFVSPIGSKILKSNSFTPGIGNKQGKFVIVSQGATITPTTTSKYTVGKKHIIKRPASEITGTLAKVQNVTSEPSGNKIMILTNQQGQQQKVLLTPAQQKLMGYQAAGAKVTKTLVKGNVIQKTATPGTSGLLTKTIVHSPATTQRITTTGQTLITSSGQLLTPIAGKSVRIEKQPILSRKLPIQSQKVNIKGPPHQKTILIKNQHGQTVRKIQGTDEELLNQQVKEQIEAIKASGGLPPPPQQQPQQQQQQQLQTPTQQKSDTSFKGTSKTIRRSYAKKVESPKVISKPVTTSASVSNKTETVIPPLTPISPKKPETTASVVSKEKVPVTQSQSQPQQQAEVKQPEQQQQQRPLNQLVIQDAMGNQTTITEGQILALPSETVDGQPQSYMLVTLDESGNLTPLNNEALMSLDPNLGLSGDLGNTVLQIDQSALKDNQNENINVEIPKTTDTIPATISKTGAEIKATEQVVETAQQQPQQPAQQQQQQQQQQVSNEPTPAALQTVNCSVSSDGNGGQQLIVTGDPVAAQKFLESLTEGNTDLANILMNAEGSILVHADGQQILINTDTDNQMLLSMAETSEGGGNPIFATQPTKNQDILAAALADTDVFQQEQNAQQGNVLETSLTLNSPIMTPLEVPSTNSKKISDENDILTQVPKNVDLPITITDPNISQTVAQQQVASMMATELQNNLELTLPDTAISVTSSEMNSPSFVYSLPSLDESVDINQKPFNSSMPLLTEDTEETIVTTTATVVATTTTTTTETNREVKTDEKSSKSEEINQEREKSDDNKDELETTLTTSTNVSTITTTTTESATITPEVSTTTVAASPTKTTTVEVQNFLDDTGLCSLGGEMCSSLSEPPPDMFDLTAVLSSDVKTDETESKIDKITSDDDDDDNKKEQIEEDKQDLIKDQSNTTTDKTIKTQETTNSPNSLNEEDSCEIPVQPEIVTNLTEFNQNLEKNHSADGKDGKN